MAEFGPVNWRTNGSNTQSVVSPDDYWRSHVRIEPRDIHAYDLLSYPVWASPGRTTGVAEPEQEHVQLPRILDSAPHNDLRELVCSYSWHCHEALAVVQCESGGNANATSPDGQNLGLFQINLVHIARVDGNSSLLYDPVINTRVAYDIWLDQSWIPWSCKPY